MDKDEAGEPVVQPSEDDDRKDDESRQMIEAQKDAAEHREDEGGYQ